MLPEIAGVNSFGLTVLAAYVAALLVLSRRVAELGLPRNWVGEGAFVATIPGLVGARLWWLAEHPDEFGGDWGAVLSGGGLTWYGGFAVGTVAVLAWGRWRGVPPALAFDTAAYVLPLVQAIGRVGCQLSGDGDYGVAWDGPWAMGYPDGVVPTPPGVEVHPTPVYEALALLAIAAYLWRRRDAYRPGGLFARYLVLVGAERFLVEFLRRNEDLVLGLTTPQAVSACLVAVGSAVLFRLGGTIARS